MDENAWLTSSDDFRSMVEHLGRGVSARKSRLLAVACCNRIGHLLTDKCLRNAISASEKYADKLIGKKDVQLAASMVKRFGEIPYGRKLRRNDTRVRVRRWVTMAVEDATATSGRYGYRSILAIATMENILIALDGRPLDGVEKRWLQIPALANECRVYCDLVRDIFGNPFRPATVEPAWLEWNGGTVVKLAQTIYDERRFELMPLLGDALEDAYCDNPDLIDHCRGPGPHVRGCWVVDLILGKS